MVLTSNYSSCILWLQLKKLAQNQTPAESLVSQRLLSISQIHNSTIC
nr:MAG TPA: hypothetical protein [Caudoviricetes sp.]